MALGRQGKLDEAIEEFQDVLELAPDLAEAHYNMAVALAKQGDVDQSLEYMQQAKQLCVEQDNPQVVQVVEQAIQAID